MPFDFQMKDIAMEYFTAGTRKLDRLINENMCIYS